MINEPIQDLRNLTEFEKINWLPINDQFEKYICSMTFKYFNNLSPLYMNDVFTPAGQNTTSKLSQPLKKTNHGQNQKVFHMCVAPCIWNKLPDFLKTTGNFNTFKHRVKKYFFAE